jgi:hypothetical protein
LKHKRHARRPNAFEVLRRADPVDAASLPGPESPEALALKEGILATSRQKERPRRFLSRRRLVLAVVFGLLSIASTTTAWVLLTREVRRPRMACYEAVSLHADRVALTSPRTLDAIECAPEWDEGVLVNPAVAQRGEVPPLTACVTDIGAVAVFPSRNPRVCEELGLATPEPESGERQERILELERALVAYFAQGRCIPVTEAKTQVAKILQDYGLKGWRVEMMPGPSERPCASFSLDAEEQVVHLVPIPDLEP